MRKGFTLLEMLVVMAIAMIMMGLVASGYQKVKRGQDLSIGAGTVQGALQTARAEAMRRNTVVYAYFLDGGKFDWDFGLMDTSGGTSANKTTDTADGYLRAFTVYDVPYDVWLKTKDGEEISHNLLPPGVAWVSLGFGAGTLANAQSAVYAAAAADDAWYTSVNPSYLSGLGRNCSLIICFSPTGTAWAINAKARNSSAISAANTLTNLRIFLLDDLQTTPFYNGSTASTTITALAVRPFVINTDLWRGAGTVGGITNNQPAGTGTPILVGDAVQKNLAKMKWLTVMMNYTTGLCYVVDGFSKETW